MKKIKKVMKKYDNIGLRTMMFATNTNSQNKTINSIRRFTVNMVFLKRYLISYTVNLNKTWSSFGMTAVED